MIESACMYPIDYDHKMLNSGGFYQSVHAC